MATTVSQGGVVSAVILARALMSTRLIASTFNVRWGSRNEKNDTGLPK